MVFWCLYTHGSKHLTVREEGVSFSCRHGTKQTVPKSLVTEAEGEKTMKTVVNQTCMIDFGSDGGTHIGPTTLAKSDHDRIDRTDIVLDAGCSAA